MRTLHFAVLIASGFMILTGSIAHGQDRPVVREPFPGDGPPKPKDEAPDESHWSIVIIAVRSDDPEEQAAAARQFLWEVRTKAGLKDAYVEQRGKSTVVAFGRYDGPEDPAARRDLERIQAFKESSGARPFEAAALAPPANAPAGSMPEYDLSRARELFGDQAIYTLQVGVYSKEGGRTPSPAELAEIRKSAEEAVRSLRREGDQAFYYHGPNRSMVTVGVFGDDDWAYDEKTGRFEERSGRIAVLRQRYPYNLLNGEAYRPIVNGKPAKELQRSALVAIPSRP